MHLWLDQLTKLQTRTHHLWVSQFLLFFNSSLFRTYVGSHCYNLKRGCNNEKEGPGPLVNSKPHYLKKSRNFLSAGSSAASSSTININFFSPTPLVEWTLNTVLPHTSPGSPNSFGYCWFHCSPGNHSVTLTWSISSFWGHQWSHIWNSTRVIFDVGNLSLDEVGSIFRNLEEGGIWTIDQIHFANDEVLADAGIPPALIDLFREDCRQDESFAEGNGISGPRY